VLQGLGALTHQHEKTYRLEVGDLILQRFFGGSAAQFSSPDLGKTSTFATFLQVHAGEVAELDLSESTLLRCVRVKICHDSLPAAAREQLGWSAMLAISSIGEVNRLVTRTEKWREEVSQWHEEFNRIDATKLSKDQVARLRAAVTALRGQLDAVEKKLG
jgi:hypothetical protein